MKGRWEILIFIVLVNLSIGSIVLPRTIDDIAEDSVVKTFEPSEVSLMIVFDYSHGQYSSYVESLDLELQASLEGLGYTIVWARGGINSTILSNATGLVLGSMYEISNGFLASEIQAIKDWFDEGSKFLWVSTDSDYSGYAYINNNMSAILESVGSHVYPEPTSIYDPIMNCNASYRVIANRTSEEAFVSPIVEGVSGVLMHGPTLLYGSNTTTNPGVGIEPVALETQNIMNVYPLLYYSQFAVIGDSDLVLPHAHNDDDTGSFVCATMETYLGASNSSTVIVSGSSPYGNYQPMFTSLYYGKVLQGDLFVKQAINYGMLLGCGSIISGPADITYEEGVSGNVLEWRAFDLYPKSYNISCEEALVRSGLWNSSSEIISIVVDGLTVGIYNYTLQVTNQANDTISDTVFVITQEQLAPTINHPEDISYFEGDNSSVIIWTPSDLSLHYYEIFKDGELIYTHYWLTDESPDVSLNVGGLPVGVYNFSITIYDKVLLETTDVVIVEVLEVILPSQTTTTTTTTITTTNTTTSETADGPSDLDFIRTATIAISIGSSLVIIAVVILIFRRR
ncbi:MAG: hypothetical protein ACFFE6_14390 [Candidatus Thorarchaeota archaeon]